MSAPHSYEILQPRLDKVMEALDVQDCSDEELAELRRVAKGLTRTNCWWVAWEIKDVLINQIDKERARRTDHFIDPETGEPTKPRPKIEGPGG